jgi:gamma-glutamylcyclotransferase (GGCT)/AIG2-like uncharacterized protein YtfP
LVFFYGTLMSGFERPGRARIDPALRPQGRASIHATLFDLGIYPAAVPSSDGRVWGEVHRMIDPEALDTRIETPVTFDDGHVAQA